VNQVENGKAAKNDEDIDCFAVCNKYAPNNTVQYRWRREGKQHVTDHHPNGHQSPQRLELVDSVCHRLHRFLRNKCDRLGRLKIQVIVAHFRDLCHRNFSTDPIPGQFNKIGVTLAQ